MAKLTEARRRILAYMADTGCMIGGGSYGHGWTCDLYQWPIAGSTIRSLVEAKMIARCRDSNEVDYHAITEKGRAALVAPRASAQGGEM